MPNTKLFLLLPLMGNEDPKSPWSVIWDAAYGFVVRAVDEEEARRLAQEQGGCETHGGDEPWLHKQYSSCEELGEGPSQVIIRDFHSG